MPRPLGQRQPPHRSTAYRARIRDLPCHICQRPAPSDPHHVVTGGMGQKCSDLMLVPLCREHHNEVGASKREWAPTMLRAALEYLADYAAYLEARVAELVKALPGVARALPVRPGDNPF